MARKNEGSADTRLRRGRTDSGSRKRVAAEDRDLTRVGDEQRGEHPDERRLPRAVGADHPEDLAGADSERHIVDRGVLDTVTSPTGSTAHSAVAGASAVVAAARRLNVFVTDRTSSGMPSSAYD